MNARRSLHRRLAPLALALLALVPATACADWRLYEGGGFATGAASAA